jgi:hypothetical protein
MVNTKEAEPLDQLFTRVAGSGSGSAITVIIFILRANADPLILK